MIADFKNILKFLKPNSSEKQCGFLISRSISNSRPPPDSGPLVRVERLERQAASGKRQELTMQDALAESHKRITHPDHGSKRSDP